MSVNEKSNERKPMPPTRKIALSFIGVIVVGSLLLSLPLANNGPSLPYIDNLFFAVSATCVTGLVPAVTADQFTLFGQIVIIILIQIGGLGFLTLLSMLVFKIRKKLSLNNRIMIQEALNQPSLNSIGQFIRKVILFTVTCEGIGALLLSTVFIPEKGFIEGAYYSIFHAISAFCNAGFDVLGANSLMPYQSNIIINLTVSALIISGGLGFIVWFDLFEKIKKTKEKCKKFKIKSYLNSLQVHTKIVLIMTITLLVSGTVLFYIFEFQNPATLQTLSVFDQVQVSYFQSVTLRTAGFASVDMAALYPHTKLFMSIFMFIGGSPAGTAGGIKTVTFAVSVLMIYNIYQGRKEVTVFQRRIKKRLIIRSFAIISISLAIATTGLFVLSITEEMQFIDLLFEVFSAFGTVGLTAGVTPALSDVGKIVIMILMYIGRIGPVTMMLSFARKSHMQKATVDIGYLDEDVLLG